MEFNHKFPNFVILIAKATLFAATSIFFSVQSLAGPECATTTPINRCTSGADCEFRYGRILETPIIPFSSLPLPTALLAASIDATCVPRLDINGIGSATGIVWALPPAGLCRTNGSGIGSTTDCAALLSITPVSWSRPGALPGTPAEIYLPNGIDPSTRGYLASSIRASTGGAIGTPMVLSPTSVLSLVDEFGAPLRYIKWSLASANRCPLSTPLIDNTPLVQIRNNEEIITYTDSTPAGLCSNPISSGRTISRCSSTGVPDFLAGNVLFNNFTNSYDSCSNGCDVGTSPGIGSIAPDGRYYLSASDSATFYPDSAADCATAGLVRACAGYDSSDGTVNTLGTLGGSSSYTKTRVGDCISRCPASAVVTWTGGGGGGDTCAITTASAGVFGASSGITATGANTGTATLTCDSALGWQVSGGTCTAAACTPNWRWSLAQQVTNRAAPACGLGTQPNLTCGVGVNENVFSVCNEGADSWGSTCRDVNNCTAVAGVCGTAAGSALASTTAPTSSLCSSGAPSAVVANAALWEWTCASTPCNTPRLYIVGQTDFADEALATYNSVTCCATAQIRLSTGGPTGQHGTKCIDLAGTVTSSGLTANSINLAIGGPFSLIRWSDGSCEGPSTVQCVAQTITWSAGNCSAVFPMTNPGSNSISKTNTLSGFIGDASFACDATGSWVTAAPASGGSCAAAPIACYYDRGVGVTGCDTYTYGPFPNDGSCDADRISYSALGGACNITPYTSAVCQCSTSGGNCTASGLSWLSGATRCYANFPTTSALDTTTVINTSMSGASGSAQFRCDVNGNWNPTPEAGSVCNAVAVNYCPAQVMTWTGPGGTCNATVGAPQVENSIIGLIDNDPMNSNIGSASYFCQMGGTWNASPQAGSTCSTCAWAWRNSGYLGSGGVNNSNFCDGGLGSTGTGFGIAGTCNSGENGTDIQCGDGGDLNRLTCSCQ